MAVVEVKTFSDIYTSVLEAAKIQSGDTTSIARIKRAINAAYRNELAPAEQWEWLRGYVDLTIDPVLTTGTVSVTENATTITFSSAPSTSKKGFLFSVDGQTETYQIFSHVAASTTAIISAPFTGSTDATANYKVWTNRIPLPSDCRETYEITHDLSPIPLEGVGQQQLRRHNAVDPKREGRPKIYSTTDYRNPDIFASIGSLPAVSTVASSGLVKTIVFASTVASLISAGDILEVSLADDETYNGEVVVNTVSTSTITYTGLRSLNENANADSNISFKKKQVELNHDRYRELQIFPAIDTDRHTLHVDYVREAPPLDADTDEPLMPISDRIVLVYYGLEFAFRNLLRNPEEANNYLAKAGAKQAKMQGKLNDSVDYPMLKPSKTYLERKRRRSRSKLDFKRFD